MKLKRLLHCLLIMAVFVVDVKVRARVVDLPKGCVKTESPCAVLTVDGVYKKEFPWGVLRSNGGDSYFVMNQHQVKLIRGHFVIEAHEPVEVVTLLGDMQIRQGHAYLDVRDREVHFTNISSRFDYKPLGESKNFDLPKGFSNVLRAISQNGVAESGFPKIAEVRPLVKGWGGLYGRKEVGVFKGQLQQFMQAWTKAQQEIGPWYAETVARAIASEKAEEARQAALKARQRVEAERWKVIFRERNYLGVDPGETFDGPKTLDQ
jgi:hypothetical protein